MDLTINRMFQRKEKESDSVSGPGVAKVTLVRTWAGDGQGEENEARTPRLGRRRKWAGERRTQSKSRQVCFSDSLQQGTNVFSHPPLPKKR